MKTENETLTNEELLSVNGGFGNHSVNPMATQQHSCPFCGKNNEYKNYIWDGYAPTMMLTCKHCRQTKPKSQWDKKQ